MRRCPGTEAAYRRLTEGRLRSGSGPGLWARAKPGARPGRERPRCRTRCRARHRPKPRRKRRGASFPGNIATLEASSVSRMTGGKSRRTTAAAATDKDWSEAAHKKPIRRSDKVDCAPALPVLSLAGGAVAALAGGSALGSSKTRGVFLFPCHSAATVLSRAWPAPHARKLGAAALTQLEGSGSTTHKHRCKPF